MTPDPLSDLIAACRELIQTMYPVIDVLEGELSGRGRAMAQHGSDTLRNDGVMGLHKGPGVPGRSASPTL